jgi:hypothetical protein
VLRAARVRTGVRVDDRLLDLARRVQLVRCGAAAAFFVLRVSTQSPPL